MDVIDKINELLTANGMTGADLSRAIDVSSGTYSQWNTRKTQPSNKNLKKIADYFGIDVYDILAGCSVQGEEPDDQTRAEAIADAVARKLSEPARPSDDDIKFALFGGHDISDETYESVKQFAHFAAEQERRQRGD